MTADIVIDCPVPPSANRLWRIGKGRDGKSYIYKSHMYQRWLWEFHYAALHLHGKHIGPFDAEILICPKRKRDADNSAKALLDACQKLGIIANDSFARKVTQELVERARAPLGCRLRITPI